MIPASDIRPALSPHDVVRSGLCIGCGSCAAQTAGSWMKMDRYGQLKPEFTDVPSGKPSETFALTCPFSHYSPNEDELAAELFPETGQQHTSSGRFLKCYVGYVTEDHFRMHGSSGGLVSWVLSELMQKGLIDGAAHVHSVADPHNKGRYFEYTISRTEADIRRGAKSRYYPVEMSGIIEAIRSTPGRYAVVGVPCFIKAVQLLRRRDPIMRKRIAFTLGLFCGHFKSARFIESFAWQMGTSIEDVRKVDYRLKEPGRPANWYCAEFTLSDGRTVKKDWWDLADGDWGAGFFMNSACNYCDDVVSETADISFGDAWVEPYSSDERGTNVVITRSPVVAQMIQNAIRDNRLQLDEVDGEFVEATQAAGLRQRREGLAYRLQHYPLKTPPRKRVAPKAENLALRRKLIYRMRYQISAWSHRVFWFARILRSPWIYTRWARSTVMLYHALTYHRGMLGNFFKRIGIR